MASISITGQIVLNDHAQESIENLLKDMHKPVLHAQADGIQVRWHDPEKPGDKNGAFIEDLIKLAIVRIQYKDDILPCHENQKAIQKLVEALHILEVRARKRREQGIEGTDQPN